MERRTLVRDGLARRGVVSMGAVWIGKDFKAEWLGKVERVEDWDGQEWSGQKIGVDVIGEVRPGREWVRTVW